MRAQTINELQQFTRTKSKDFKGSLGIGMWGQIKQLLREEGKKISLKDKNALFIVCASTEREDLMDFIISQGLDINSQEHNILRTLAWNERPDIVVHLVKKYGADIEGAIKSADLHREHHTVDHLEDAKELLKTSIKENKQCNMRAIFINENKAKHGIYLSDERKLPKNIKLRISDEYGRKPTPEEAKEIDKSKELFYTFQDGNHEINVYFVDIKPIRDISYGDFVEGGNDESYPNFIPRYEIWIDSIFKNDLNRVYQILVHEAIERKLMEEDPNREYYKETAKTRKYKNLKKEGAHEEANEVEKELRDEKITFQEALEKYYES
jgi:hypothetical protein